MGGNIPFRLFLDGSQGIEESEGRVGFGGCGQVEAGLSQMESSFGQTHAVECLSATIDNANGVRIRQPHIFAGKNEHTAKDETGVFPGIDHFRQPVEGGVRV